MDHVRKSTSIAVQPSGPMAVLQMIQQAIDLWSSGTLYSCNTTKPLMVRDLHCLNPALIPEQALSEFLLLCKALTQSGKQTCCFQSLNKHSPPLVRITKSVITKIAIVSVCESWRNMRVQQRCLLTTVCFQAMKTAAMSFDALFVARFAMPICSEQRSS